MKRIKFQSPLLSRFWGRPIYIGATVLLPKSYDEHPGVLYPTVYIQAHFSLAAPFSFSTQSNPNEKSWAPERAKAIVGHLNIAELQAGGGPLQTRYEFYKEWNSDDYPRMILVTFQHPTPFYDDSYAVHSETEGPYGDALLTEVIPQALCASPNRRLHRWLRGARSTALPSGFPRRRVDVLSGPGGPAPLQWRAQHL